MSDLEQSFHSFLNSHPEIRASNKLINTRALARFFIREGHIKQSMEAVVAMIRRTEIKPLTTFADKKIFSDIKISIRDEITIMDYEKTKGIFENISDIIARVSYDKSETLKVVVGSHSVKVIIDSNNSKAVKQVLKHDHLLKEYKNISEISLFFTIKALDAKGIVSYVTTELLLAGINIMEIITCTPELIIYVDEEQSLKTHETLKRLKKGFIE